MAVFVFYADLLVNSVSSQHPITEEEIIVGNLHIAVK